MTWFKPSKVLMVSKVGGGSRLSKSKSLMAAAVVLIGGFEGYRSVAYIPIPGDVPTICFGETRGVKMGDRKTLPECQAMLGDALVEFETGMRKCLTAPDAIPEKPYTTFLSATYNIGTKGFCGSSMARLANAGDLRGACNALLAWNKAGGRVVPGLTRRRQEERAVCLSGL